MTRSGKELNYFIRGDYVTNPVKTYNQDEIERYWTFDRIQSSSLYQYHVYNEAQKIFLANNCTSLIDLGSGPGTKAKLFFSEICNNVYLADQPSVANVVREVYPDANFIPLNLERDSISNSRKYDMIICSDVIEHLEDPDKLISQIKNLMTTSSIGVLSTPDRVFRRGKNSLKSPNDQHVREWSKDELKAYLEFHGLTIINHFNRPLMKLSFLTELIYRSSRALGVKVNKSNWFANQVVVFKIA
jgi:SAM-dependent methyltransferase